MQKYIQRSKAKFITIMEAWNDIANNTNLTQRSVDPAHTKHYWRWKTLRVNCKKNINVCR